MKNAVNPLVVCHACGKSFVTKPCLVLISKFCSRECRILKCNRRQKEHRYDVKCQECGNFFGVIESRKQSARFCSIKCANEGRSKVRRAIPDNVILNLPVGSKGIVLACGNVAIVDEKDFEGLNKFKWHASGGYAFRWDWANGAPVGVSMHRFILSTPDNLMTDHINRNRLDNRKANLRAVTQTQNLWNSSLRKNNTSGITGIRFDKRRNCWIARITHNSTEIYLGSFSNKPGAEKAYASTAKLLRGDFARDAITHL